MSAGDGVIAESLGPCAPVGDRDQAVQGRSWPGHAPQLHRHLPLPSHPPAASDGVSSLHFSPTANHLVATSWSGQTLCWEVQAAGQNVQSIPKAAIQSDKPVLCSAWNADGTGVFVGKAF